MMVQSKLACAALCLSSVGDVVDGHRLTHLALVDKKDSTMGGAQECQSQYEGCQAASEICQDLYKTCLHSKSLMHVDKEDGGPQGIGRLVADGSEKRKLVDEGEGGDNSGMESRILLEEEEGMQSGTERQSAECGQEPGRFCGRVTHWFYGRGYGFIRPDAGGENLVFHLQDVSGHEVPEESSRVEYSMTTNPREPWKKIATHVTDAFGAPVKPSSKGSSKGWNAKGQGKMPSSKGGSEKGKCGEKPGRFCGTVSHWFNNDGGYGFIRPDAGGDDLFFHLQDVSGHEVPEESSRVEYSMTTDPREPWKKIATHVTDAFGAPVKPSSKGSSKGLQTWFPKGKGKGMKKGSLVDFVAEGKGVPNWP